MHAAVAKVALETLHRAQIMLVILPLALLMRRASRIMQISNCLVILVEYTTQKMPKFKVYVLKINH